MLPLDESALNLLKVRLVMKLRNEFVKTSMFCHSLCLHWLDKQFLAVVEPVSWKFMFENKSDAFTFHATHCAISTGGEMNNGPNVAPGMGATMLS